MTLCLTVFLKRPHSEKISTQSINHWKLSRSTCFDTSRAGVPIRKIHMIQKVAYMPTICVTSGDRQKFSSIFQKIVNTCQEQIKRASLAGSNAHKAFFATSVTQLLSVYTIRISTKGFTAIGLDAIRVRFALSFTLSRREITLKRYAKTTGNKCKIKSTTSISMASTNR